MSGKNSLKDKLEEDELDLSMMQLTEVPVKEIEQFGTKVLKINLSHNLLTYIPANLPLLSHITTLDLSKNQLTELPENFGQLKNLKSLDLYANSISKLPVSFAQLKSLKWLDLKDNPLVPALAQAAGPCITPNDCALCAKKVVALLQSMESQLMRERQKKMEEAQKVKKEKERQEELERERLRQEKRAAKEKRREEAKNRETEQRRFDEQKWRYEMQVNGNTANGSNRNGNAGKMSGGKNAKSGAGKMNGDGSVNGHAMDSGVGGGGLCGFLFRLITMLLVLSLGLAVSLLWVYTDGRMDSDSIQRALPVIQTDVEDYVLALGHKTAKYFGEFEKVASPYVEKAMTNGRKMWKEGGKQIRSGAKWVSDNYGDEIQTGWNTVKQYARLAMAKISELLVSLKPHLEQLWAQAKPHLQSIGEFVIEKSLKCIDYIYTQFPVYVDWLREVGAQVGDQAQKTWQKWAQGA